MRLSNPVTGLFFTCFYKRLGRDFLSKLVAMPHPPRNFESPPWLVGHELLSVVLFAFVSVL